MIKAYVDFELGQPLEKTADETLDEVIETLLCRAGKGNGNVEEIQNLAKAVKDIAIAKAVLSRMKS